MYAYVCLCICFKGNNKSSSNDYERLAKANGVARTDIKTQSNIKSNAELFTGFSFPAKCLDGVTACTHQSTRFNITSSIQNCVRTCIHMYTYKHAPIYVFCLDRFLGFTILKRRQNLDWQKQKIKPATKHWLNVWMQKTSRVPLTRTALCFQSFSTATVVQLFGHRCPIRFVLWFF